MKVISIQYKDLSEKELVDLTLQNENAEAILFIIFEKYDPLLKKSAMQISHHEVRRICWRGYRNGCSLSPPYRQSLSRMAHNPFVLPLWLIISSMIPISGP